MARFLDNRALAENAVTVVTSAAPFVVTRTTTTILQFTGTAAQVVTLPDAKTLEVGMRYYLNNRSSEVIVVNYNDGSPASQIPVGKSVELRVLSIASLAGLWDVQLFGSGSVDLVNGGMEFPLETNQITYTVPAGKVHWHPFMTVRASDTLTVDAGARLISSEDVVEGTVIVNLGAIWKVL